MSESSHQFHARLRKLLASSLFPVKYANSPPKCEIDMEIIEMILQTFQQFYCSFGLFLISRHTKNAVLRFFFFFVFFSLTKNKKNHQKKEV